MASPAHTLAVAARRRAVEGAVDLVKQRAEVAPVKVLAPLVFHPLLDKGATGRLKLLEKGVRCN
jgi:hypothetical protein